MLKLALAGQGLVLGGSLGSGRLGGAGNLGSPGVLGGGSRLPGMSPLLGSFSNLGIQCVKKKEIEAAIEKKLQLGIDPFKGGGAQEEPFLGAETPSLQGNQIPWGCPQARPAGPLTVPSPLLSPSRFPQEPPGGGHERGEDLLPGLLQGQLRADTAPQPSALGAHLRQEYVAGGDTNMSPVGPPAPSLLWDGTGGEAAAAGSSPGAWVRLQGLAWVGPTWPAGICPPRPGWDSHWRPTGLVKKR